MTEVKHTPGPWIVDPDSPTDISPADDLRLGIASICHADEAGGRWEFGEQSKANAKLIAAAPDLLRCLEQYVKACEFQGIKLGPITGDACDAIRKATQ